MKSNQENYYKKHQKLLSEKANYYSQIFSDYLSKGYGSKFVIDLVRDNIKNVYEKPELTAHLSCKKKCYFCCHDRIPISHIEELHLKKVLNRFKRNAKQLKLHQNTKDFNKLDWKDKQCGFLKDNKECSIYEERPLACRVHNSTGNPELCKLNKNNESGNHGQIYSLELEAMQIALFSMSGFKETWLHDIIKL